MRNKYKKYRFIFLITNDTIPYFMQADYAETLNPNSSTKMNHHNTKFVITTNVSTLYTSIFIVNIY